MATYGFLDILQEELDKNFPFECATREVYEELGIHLNEDCLLWSKIYPSMLYEGRQSVFMVGQLSQDQFDSITFGDEGQAYKLMSIE